MATSLAGWTLGLSSLGPCNGSLGAPVSPLGTAYVNVLRHKESELKNWITPQEILDIPTDTSPKTAPTKSTERTPKTLGLASPKMYLHRPRLDPGDGFVCSSP